MNKNVGSSDRVLRTVVAVAVLLAAVLVPLQLGIRAGLAALGVYLGTTALAGTCLGYRMMGLSTCPIERR